MSLDVSLYYTVEENKNIYVFEANTTHNLTKMAREYGYEDEAYYVIWHPEELGFKQAKQLIPTLENLLFDMIENDNLYKKHNPSNGWGSYEGFLKFVSKYLKACKTHPNSNIYISR